MPYQTDDRNKLIFRENLNRFNNGNYIKSKCNYIRANSLYQRHKTDEELMIQEEVIKRKELDHLKRRGINVDHIVNNF